MYAEGSCSHIQGRGKLLIDNLCMFIIFATSTLIKILTHGSQIFFLHFYRPLPNKQLKQYGFRL